jgi:hypothetical protein
MPPTCTVCRLPNRQEVEEAILAGTPLRNIAERFGTSLGALHRHKEGHLPAKLVKAAGSREELSGQALLERVLSLSRQAEEILAEARSGKKPGLALAAIGRASALLELQGKCLAAMKIVNPECPRCKASEVEGETDGETTLHHLCRLSAGLYEREPIRFFAGIRFIAAERLASREGISVEEAVLILQAKEDGPTPPPDVLFVPRALLPRAPKPRAES